MIISCSSCGTKEGNTLFDWSLRNRNDRMVERKISLCRDCLVKWRDTLAGMPLRKDAPIEEMQTDVYRLVGGQRSRINQFIDKVNGIHQNISQYPWSAMDARDVDDPDLNEMTAMGRLPKNENATCEIHQI